MLVFMNAFDCSTKDVSIPEDMSADELADVLLAFSEGKACSVYEQVKRLYAANPGMEDHFLVLA